MAEQIETSPTLDGWKTQPFPAPAEALKARSEQIIERWMQTVREFLPAAEHLTLSQLRDHVPLILAQIVEALHSALPEPAARVEQMSRPHGDVRFHQEYNVNELMIEYGLLRRIIFQEVAAELGRDLTGDELAAISLNIDTAQRRGIVAFVDHLGGQIRASDELQSSYISHLNHDLRGGMNGILLMVEVLKRELANYPQLSEASDDLDAMRRSVLESVATMDRFVYAHKLGRGKVQPRFGAIDLRALIVDIVDGHKHSAKERGVDLEVTFESPCEVESDRDLVRLILHNVINNTVRHARKGGGNAVITARPRAGGGCHVEVRDTGPGIAPEQLATVLKVSPPGKGGKGIKLGLPVSKLAADLIGATFTIESTVGQGTIVRLEIPNRGIGTPGI